MKKTAIIVLSILAFVGCSDIEVIEHYPDAEINFYSSADNMVRATTYDNKTFEQFFVWGVYNNNGAIQYIMNELPVNKVSGSWSYEGKKYWPAEGEVDFVGIYPSTTIAQTVLDPRTNTPSSSVSYTVSEAAREIRFSALRANAKANYATALPDVLYAVAEDMTKDSEAGNVQMTFRHAMNQIKLEVKNENPMWALRFRPDSAVILHNVRHKGTYTLPSSSTTTGVDTLGSWSAWPLADAQPEDFTILTGSTLELLTFNSADDKQNYIRSGVFMKDGANAFMVPCHAAPWEPSTGVAAKDQDGAYFEIWCRVEVTTPSMNEGTAPFVIWGDIDAKTAADEGYYKPVFIPVEVNWKEGICYKYTFAFGRGLGYNEDCTPATVPLTFSTEASSFTDAGAQDVTVK